MAGDYSRKTFDAKKHYSSVLMQQGRVQLDADWNEQAEITSYHIETGTADIIGGCGAPMHIAGFKIEPFIGSSPEAGNFYISAGHYYVDGILCENEQKALFTDQTDFPNASPLNVRGIYLIYLDVWQQQVTSLEDANIREVALGGPDTTTRLKTVWQVKTLQLEDVKLVTNCLQDFPIWNAATAPVTGQLRVSTVETTLSDDPCNFISSGGYRGLENQLYRVEIHRSGNENSATFKWSRDNGSVATKWKGQDATNKNILQVETTGPDQALGLTVGQWIELTDDRHELLGEPGILVKLSDVSDNVLTINAATIKDPRNATATSVDITRFSFNPKIRRWDSAGELQLNNPETGINIEDGIQVQFSAGTYKTGDFWMVPARILTGNIEWPTDANNRNFQLPYGIQHHYCRLAILDFNKPESPLISDCRKLFPPVTELTSLFYVSGDGQEERPGIKLPQPIKVGVANGEWPVSGAYVRFEVLSGDGVLSDGTVITGDDGIAGCTWTLGGADTSFSQQVKATLLDAAGNPVHLPVIFNASLKLATLHYVSGDGQEAMPGQTLPQLLKVGVSYEQWPVPDAKVRFDVLTGGGTLSPNNILVTDKNGIAECKWELGGTGSPVSQQVQATLLDIKGNPLHLPVIFTANLSIASNILFDDAGCKNWGNEPHHTVAEAITSLCMRKSEGKGCSVTVGKGGQFASLEEAFNTEDQDVCICLLPGEHSIGDIIVTKKTIKISGCGATILSDGNKLLFEAEKITLHDFDLKTNKDSGQLIFKVQEISTTNCTFARLNDDKETPFILLVPYLQNEKETAVIKWNANKIVATKALALSIGVGGWLEDNIILGDVFLLFDGKNNEKYVELKWESSSVRDNRRTIELMLLKYLVIKHNNEVLNMRGNIFNRITTNIFEELVPKNIQPQSIQERFGYKNLVISNNIFHGTNSSFIAETISITNTHFSEVKLDDRTLLTYALGYRGVIIGNIGPEGDAIAIDTLFGRKVIDPNLTFVR